MVSSVISYYLKYVRLGLERLRWKLLNVHPLVEKKLVHFVETFLKNLAKQESADPTVRHSVEEQPLSSMFYGSVFPKKSCTRVKVSYLNFGRSALLNESFWMSLPRVLFHFLQPIDKQQQQQQQQQNNKIV